MGIPKFFKHLCERYPGIYQMVKEHDLPDFDNFYLDMNGIIHPCSHPNEDDKNWVPRSENEIFIEIFKYLEMLVRIVKPQKLLFLAIDGVAPRAKMNQQRARRYRAAKDLERKTVEENERAAAKKEKSKDLFDSNCITPGTTFMYRLEQQLCSFIQHKVSTDPLWQVPEIILSGPQTPGEGEHKIMDYIRFIKSKADYNPYTRHLLYGLDADLIMLGLSTHEPNFMLLREEVFYGREKSTKKPTNFYLLCISLLRDYLHLEFSPLEQVLGTKFDMEHIVNDWVFMCFLIGNDFIPHLPGMHINEGVLPILYNAYMTVRPYMSGCINFYGELNLQNFGIFIKYLAKFDIEHYFSGDVTCHFDYTNNKFEWDLLNITDQSSVKPDPKTVELGAKTDRDLCSLVESTLDFLDGDDITRLTDLLQIFSVNKCEQANHTNLELTEYLLTKTKYYEEKFGWEDLQKDHLTGMANEYVRAIQWNLYYYFHGVPSWSWYYPYHYSPHISDLKEMSTASLDLKFTLGDPFAPFIQLLAVLPPYSRKLLPEFFHSFMLPGSPVAEFYPVSFETDLNGKKAEWEAVVLIPFIDADELLTVTEGYKKKLTVDERLRNMESPMFSYKFNPDGFGTLPPTIYFPSSCESLVSCTQIFAKTIRVPIANLVHGVHPKFDKTYYIQGFPTLNYLPHKGELLKVNMKVFDRPSAHDSMVIQLLDDDNLIRLKNVLIGSSDGDKNLITLRQDIGNKHFVSPTYVQYPYMIEARIKAVYFDNFVLVLSPDGATYMYVEDYQDSDEKLPKPFNDMYQKLTDQLYKTLAVSSSHVNIKGIVKAHVVVGREYLYLPSGRAVLQKVWSQDAKYLPLSSVLFGMPEKYVGTQFTLVAEIFTPGKKCIPVRGPHIGHVCEILESHSDSQSVRVKVNPLSFPPIKNKFEQLQADTYVKGYAASSMLRMNSGTFAMITGTLSIPSQNLFKNKSYVIIGLSLKLHVKNEQVLGYTKKENSEWLYSIKTVELVRQYRSQFPELFKRLDKMTGRSYAGDRISLNDLFGNPVNVEELNNVLKWLESTGIDERVRRSIGTVSMSPTTQDQIKNYIKDWNNSKSKIEFCPSVVADIDATDLFIKNSSHMSGLQFKFNLLDICVVIKSSDLLEFGDVGAVLEMTSDACNVLPINKIQSPQWIPKTNLLHILEAPPKPSMQHPFAVSPSTDQVPMPPASWLTSSPSTSSAFRFVPHSVVLKSPSQKK